MELALFNSASGIGDAVCMLYAGAGFVEAGYDVTLYSRQAHWLSRCVHHGLTITDAAPPKSAIDVNQDYQKQLRFSEDRKQWYCDAVSRALSLEPGIIKPVVPAMDVEPRSNPTRKSGYVVLSPFAAFRGREWPSSHWARLAYLLHREKIQTLALATSSDSKRLEATFKGSGSRVSWYAGKGSEWVIDCLLHSSLVIGNDSGICHLAGLFNIPTLSIVAQMPGASLFSHTRVATISPSLTCSPCRFQSDRGYYKCCFETCSALGAVTPQQILEAVKEVLSNA